MQSKIRVNRIKPLEDKTIYRLAGHSTGTPQGKLKNTKTMENEKRKTLKEIWETGKQSYSHANIQGVGLDDLRADAVKWVKHWKHKWENPISNDPAYKQSLVLRMEAFAAFFNLTEEDLK